MTHRTARLALAVAAGAASLFVSAPAEAGTVTCTTSNIDVPNLDFNVGGAFNCTLDNASDCLYVYDPLFSFPTRVASETVEVATCTA